MDREGNLYGLDFVSGGNKARTELRFLDGRGNLGSLLARTPDYDISGENPFQPTLIWCTGGDGAIIEGYSETYEIRIHNRRGEIIRRILKDYDPVEVTAEERGIFAKLAKESIRKTTYKFSRFHPAYISLLCDEKGWIYAGTPEKTLDGKRTIYNIFDQDGRYQGDAAWSGWAALIRDEKLYTGEEDAGGYPVIKRYALTWRNHIR